MRGAAGPLHDQLSVVPTPVPAVFICCILKVLRTLLFWYWGSTPLFCSVEWFAKPKFLYSSSIPAASLLFQRAQRMYVTHGHPAPLACLWKLELVQWVILKPLSWTWSILWFEMDPSITVSLKYLFYKQWGTWIAWTWESSQSLQTLPKALQGSCFLLIKNKHFL